VIGAMKAGTTSLWEYLRGQPSVFMAEAKELDFFVAEKEWSRGAEWYEQQFAAAPATAIAVGEASTNYSKHPLFDGVPARAVALLPDVKVVYLVRQPLERMRSQWLHARSAGWESRSFARAVAQDPQYVDVSRYAHQLEQWLAHVPRERLFVETSERMRDDPFVAMGAIMRFLGIDDAVVLADHRVHTADQLPPARRALARSLKASPTASRAARFVPQALRRAYGRATTTPVDRSAATLPPEQEASILDGLRPDLARLREIVGGDFDAWGLV
jgi:hypothetical protein